MNPSRSSGPRSFRRLLPSWLPTTGDPQLESMPGPSRDILLLCSPNLAIVDSWYAPLKFAKDAHPYWTVRVMFPSFYQVKKLDLADAVVVGIQDIASCFLYRGLDHRLYAFRTLSAAKRSAAASLKLAEVFAPKKPGASPRLIQRMAAERRARSCRWILYSSCLLLLPRYGWVANRPSRKLLNSLKHSTVAYDTLSQEKRNVPELLNEVLLGPRLSINHGLGFREPMAADAAEKSRTEREQVRANETDFRIYVYNEAEKHALVNQLGVEQDRVIITGVPRLDPCAREIMAALRRPCDTIPFDRHIFFISRSLNKRHSSFKNDCLRSVHDFANDSGLGLVIRTHPSEMDSRIFEALPRDGHGRTWVLSKAHPQTIAASAVFAVCFESSLPAELLAFGVPTIAFGETPTGFASTRDRHLGLFLPADSIEEFRETARALLRDASTHVAALTAATGAHYAEPDGALEAILRDFESLATEHDSPRHASQESMRPRTA